MKARVRSRKSSISGERVKSMLASPKLLAAIDRAEAGIRPLQRGYNGALSKVETTLKVTTMMRIVLSTAAAAALLCLHATPSQAQYSGTAPWCAVIQVGTGGVHYE